MSFSALTSPVLLGMCVIDWLIIVLPLGFVFFMGFKSMKYIHGATEFLAAGRAAGRYILSVADVASGLSVLAIVSFVEMRYQTGFAISFWQNLTHPIGIIIALFGFCTYRFRETRALSLGQFLEVRYNRSLRVFACSLRTVSEILANMIAPAIAARFFIYFLDLPHTFTLFGVNFDTYPVLIGAVLLVAVSIIWMGGTLSLIITDTIQGLLCYPTIAIFIVFLLCKFSWSGEILPVMLNRAEGQSFINPYDMEELRDFNIFYLVGYIIIFQTFYNRASWLGGGNTSAARTPQEGKMAGVLGNWRNAVISVFYLVLGATVITLLNHGNFAAEGHETRVAIVAKAASDPAVGLDEAGAAKVAAAADRTRLAPEDFSKQRSHSDNLDSPYLAGARAAIAEASPDEIEGAVRFQRFRALYHQVMFAISMKKLLPVGLIGLFSLAMIMMLISTDDSRIFNSASTLAQDVILPFLKKPPTPRRHIWMLRWVSLGVGLFFFAGSSYMSQLDFIQLFCTLMTMFWLGGGGAITMFGLYSSFGTTAGAFASLLASCLLAGSTVFLQRNWVDVVYPWIVNNNYAEAVSAFLVGASRPFSPYVQWTLSADKFPINSYELSFISMIVCVIVYVAVSYATCRERFNLDRMLHRGKYNLNGEHGELTSKWSWKSLFGKLIGITPEYSRTDKIIAWGVFGYVVIYGFFALFVAVVIWNWFFRWPDSYWGYYFLITAFIVPGIVAVLTMFWFGIGSVFDMKRLFKTLRENRADPLDNGQVEGNVSLADKAMFEKLERK